MIRTLPVFLAVCVLAAGLAGCASYTHSVRGPGGEIVHVILVQSLERRIAPPMREAGHSPWTEAEERQQMFEARAQQVCPQAYRIIGRSAPTHDRMRSMRRTTEEMRIVCTG